MKRFDVFIAMMEQVARFDHYAAHSALDIDYKVIAEYSHNDTWADNCDVDIIVKHISNDTYNDVSANLSAKTSVSARKPEQFEAALIEFNSAVNMLIENIENFDFSFIEADEREAELQRREEESYYRTVA